MGNVCSLCRVGLVPLEPGTQWTTNAVEPPMVVQGRQLSGILCPMCKAELTQADLENCRCALCSEIFSPERIHMLRQQASVDKSRIAMDIFSREKRRY